MIDLLDAIRRRKTTNGPFLPDPVSEEHQRLLMEVAGRAPSQLNSQPWRFVIVDDRSTIEAIAQISGASMTEAMSNGMGAAMENVWVTVGTLGMGIQFVSFPMEVHGQWERIVELLHVPEDLELMAVYRLGYLPVESRRPAIDWTSRQRKLPSQYVFRNRADTPQTGWDDAAADNGRV